MALDPAYIALIGTLCGGVGLKMAEHYLGKGGRKTDDASRIRDELRIEINNLRDDVTRLEDERDKYRNDYYTLYEKHLAVLKELNEALVRIRSEADITTDAENARIDETAGPPPEKM